MARSIKVEIVGDASSLKSAFAQAGGSASGFGSAMGKVGKAALVAGAAIGGALVAGTVYAVKKFAEFESALNTFQSVSGATADQMKIVSDRAKDLGNDLSLPGTSAKDAALAMSELAKGGLSVSESMDAAKAAIQLSTAAEVDNAHAAEILADALNTFGLKGKDAAHVADLLANGANATTASIDDMAMALKAVGNVANQVGLNIDETTTALGLMAAAGLKGSDAGTSLKTMLLSLAAPTEKAAGLMAELGFRTRDMHGELLPMPQLIENWRAATEGMTAAQELAAMKVIFGTDAVRAAGAILGSEKGKWDEMAAAMGRQGAAADVAAAKSKGLAGAWDALKSALETAAITIGEKIAPAVEKAVRWIGEFVSKLANAKSAGDAFNMILDAIGTVFGKIGARLNEAVNAIDWGVVGHRMFELFSAAVPPAFAGIAKVFAGVFTGIGTAIGEALNTQLINALQTITSNVSTALAGVVSSIGDAVEAFDALDAALPGHPLGDLADKLRGVEDALHGVADRARNFQTAEEKLNAEIKQGNEFIEAQAEMTQFWADRLHGAGGAVKVLDGDLQKMAGAVISTTGQMKLADAAALVLAASYGRIPTKVETTAFLHDPAARAVLQAWVAQINATPKTADTKANVFADEAIQKANQLHNRINAIPDKHNTHATSSGGSTVIGTANAISGAIRSIPTSWHTTHTISTNYVPGSSPGPGFATGGRVTSNMLAMVGERGRELVALPAGAYVYPNNETEQIVANLDRLQAGKAAQPDKTWGFRPGSNMFSGMGDAPVAQAVPSALAAAAPIVNVIVNVAGPITSRRDFAQEIRDALAEFSQYTPSLWAGRA